LASTILYFIEVVPVNEATGENVTIPVLSTVKVPTVELLGIVPATKVTLVTSIALEPAWSFDNTLIVIGEPTSVVALSSEAEGPAKAVTVFVTVAKLFAGVGSPVVLVILAVLLSVPVYSEFILSFIVSVAVAPLVNVPIVHVGETHVPCEGVPALEYVTLAGTASETETAAASLGPLFFAVSVYVIN